MSQPTERVKLTPRNKKELINIIVHEMTHYGKECDLNHIDTSLITDMSMLFFVNETYGFNGNISKWNTSHVTNMEKIFANSLFTGDISCWDVSHVKNMSEAFMNTLFNNDLSKWNTSNVINMKAMFERSCFNQNISQWDVSKVEDMREMFSRSYFNYDIGQWNVSNVTNMYQMFTSSLFNKDISSWDVRKVTCISDMFSNSNFSWSLDLWKPISISQSQSTFLGAPCIAPYWYFEDPLLITQALKQKKAKEDLKINLEESLTSQHLLPKQKI